MWTCLEEVVPAPTHHHHLFLYAKSKVFTLDKQEKNGSKESGASSALSLD